MLIYKKKILNSIQTLIIIDPSPKFEQEALIWNQISILDKSPNVEEEAYLVESEPYNGIKPLIYNQNL